MATMDNCLVENHQNIVPELYFLIAKFLSNGPFQSVGEVLRKTIEEQKILPKRLDWTGVEHEQSYAELERKYAHIGPQHLLQICTQVTSLLNKELPPSVAGFVSLLGAGRQSVLRTIENITQPRSLVDYSTRFHSMPLLDGTHRKLNHNIVKVLYGRETSASITRKQTITNEFYTKTQLLRRTLGHLSAVYCVLFDRTGKYIITGADDLLVKVWSAIDGRLLFTYRGASSEITDIAISLDNSLLAAGSLDHILRVWDLQSASPIAVLTGHTGMITSVNFCPSPRNDLKYLVTTSTDGSVAFWRYVTPRGQRAQFEAKPTQYLEKIRPGQSQMIYASFSPGGIFLAAGSADHYVRVYLMSEEGPKRILETEAHSDTVDSIQWAHNGLRFISGSKDGSAHVWHFETQQWKSLKLYMTERLPSCPPPADENKKLKVTMVAWDLTDKFVITAVSDYTIKVWDADSGKLHKVMRGHTEELYVLESHPKDPYILISAGHDGQLFIWDIFEGRSLVSFSNHIEGQGHGGVFDAKWSPDGTMIAATDSHGHILMYGFGAGHERLKTLPTELFFHTDYRPLIRDANHYVMDEQTQTVPHLMPPPFLVDIDGNPYPPAFQRLVPGREKCATEQLVPNINVGPEGVEIVEGPNAVSNIDRMIAALAHRQGQVGDPNNGNGDNAAVHGGNVGGPAQLGVSPAAAAAAAALNRLNNGGVVAVGPPVAGGSNQNASANSPRASVSRLAVRRDVEGVRQSSGNWQNNTGSFKWIRRMFVRPMASARLVALKQTVYTAGQQEQEIYRREMRRRPLMINTSAPNASVITRAPTRLRGRHIGRTRNTGQRLGTASSSNSVQPQNQAPRPTPSYRTRAQRDQEQQRDDEDDDDQSVTSASSDSSDGTVAEDQISSGSSSSDSESSDYSDWVGAAEQPTTLEPPKRSRRKPVKPRSYSPSSDLDSARPSTSRGATRPTARRRVPLGENGEIPEEYRPPEWLSEVVPRKAPYYPQMGDEVVYFRQGHERYLEAVREKNVYKLNNNCEPWIQLDLREHEIVKVIGIKYEIRPPRLCCLKLGLMNNDGTLTRQTFTVKYHDMADVIDFIVLRQTFDTAVRRLWMPGDRFRCMIDDGWWMGQIEERVPLQTDFPNSLFMCFKTRWDNGEHENMSPWDMEPIDNHRVPTEVGGVVYVEPEELRATLYQPTTEEWIRGDRDASCRRIVAGLEQVMLLGIAEPFLAPVDLNIYPSYAFVVEYPIDLSTIKARFENHFYRRITSAQFDVRYMATNAEKFNQTNSHIVKNARIITDLCLRIIKEPNIVDVIAIYHQLMDTYVTSDSEDGQRPGTSTGGITPSSSRRKKKSTRGRSDTDWRIACREVLDMIWSCNDSEPFREPVDTLEHPDYLQIIDTPMDLMTIKEDLIGGNYASQAAFIKDMRLIFTNSKNYNTNKRSRIYAMTLRLHNLFEAQMRAQLKGIRSTDNARRTNGHARYVTPATAARNRGHRSGTTNGPSTSSSSRTQRRTNNSNQHLGETGDELEVINEHRPTTSTPRKRATATSTAAAAAAAAFDARASRRRNQSNGVSSSMHLDGPSTSRSTAASASTSRLRARPQASDSDDSSQHSTHGSSWDEDGDDDDGILVSDLGTARAVRKRNRRHSDSEESYNPTPKKRVGGRKPKKDTNGRGRPRPSSSEDDEDEEVDVDDNNAEEANEARDVDVESSNDGGRRRPGRRRKVRQNDSDHTYQQATNGQRARRRIDSSHRSDGNDSDAASAAAAVARPTRSALKRTRQNWGREEDSLEDTHDDEVVIPQSSRTPVASVASSSRILRARRNLYQDSDAESNDGQNTSQKSQTSARSSRSATNRTAKAPETAQNNDGDNDDTDDDDSDDDQVLSQLANQRTRPKRGSREPPTPVTNGTARSREIARRKQSVTPSTSSIASSSTNTNSRTNSVTLDHNYIENSRRVPALSRHQQLPASELSTTLAEDPLRLPDRIEMVTRRLRDRAPAAANAITSSTGRRRNQVNYGEDDEDDEDEEVDDEENGENEVNEVDDNDDGEEGSAEDDLEEEEASGSSDDDKPLGSLLASSESQKSLRHRPADNGEAGPSSRSTRTVKRLYYNYNEDSDDESVTAIAIAKQSVLKRRRLQSDNDFADARSPYKKVRGGQINDDDDADDEPQISVSSRGRVRKISNRVKGYFRE